MRKDWELEEINDICLVTDYVANGSFQSLNENVKYNYEKDYAILLRTTDFTNSFKKEFVYVNEDAFNFLKKSTVFANDIIICNVGSVGITFLVPDLGQPMTIGPNSILVRPLRKDYLDFHFLYYLIISPYGQNLIKSITTGTTQSKFNKTNFRQLRIPIPPLPEQKRIVSILDKAFAAIDKAKANAVQNLNNAKELFNNSVNRLFENNNGWIKSKLVEHATFRNGMNFSRSSKGETIKIVGVKDFQNNYWVPFESLETVNLDNKLKDIDALNKNDIIAVRSNGNPELIGRTLLAGDFKGKVSHSGFTIRIRLNNDELLPTYVCHYLKSQKARRSLIDSGNGVGIKSLNQGSLSNLSIAFPQSNREQKNIVSTIEVLQNETKKLNEIYCKKLNDLEELKKSILHKAFNGEL